MKKLHILTLVLASTLPAKAADGSPNGTPSNPFVLQIGGENVYEFSGTYSTPVWKYTAPEDQLVSVKVGNASTSMKVTYDGNAYSSMPAPNVKTGDVYTFIIRQDMDLYLNVTSYESPVTLEASAVPHRYNLGVSADEALDVTVGGTDLFVPFREEQYEEVPVYLKYTADEDGALNLVFSGYVHNASYSTAPDGTYTGLTCRADGDTYRTYVPVEAGRTYWIRASSTGAKTLTASLTHPVYGESEDYPVIITDGTATVPAAAGTYYYEVTGTESGYAVVYSDVTDLDGTVAWGSTIGTGLVTVDDGTFDLRQRASLNAHYRIIVTRRTPAAAPQQFHVRFEPQQPYDSFYAGQPLADGEEVTLPPYPGTYYYKVTAPAQGAYILKCGPVIPFADKDSDIRLYRPDDSSTPLYIGEPDIYCEVQAGESYIVSVKYTEADKRNEILARFIALQQGDGASDPFIIKIGENALPAGDAKYYLYRAEKNSRAVVTPADMSINAPTVKRIKSENNATEQTVEILRHGDSYRFEAEAGQSYLLRFTKVKTATDFEFSTPDYPQGESRFDPFEVSGNTLEIPAEPCTYWWSYTPERTGKLHLTTDLKYDIVSSPTRENSVKLCAADGTVLTSLPVDYTEEVFGEAVCNVTAGTVYLIRVMTVSEQEGRTVSLEMADLDPGETPGNAIEILPDEAPFAYTVDKHAQSFYSGSRWYSINLKEGDLDIYSTASISFYLFEEKEDGTYTQSDAEYYAGVFWDKDYTNKYFGIQDKPITRAGRYLIAFYYIYTDASVTFDGTAIDTAAGVTAPEATADGTPRWYDLQGREVRDPAHGLYIRVTPTSTTKVLIP